MQEFTVKSPDHRLKTIQPFFDDVWNDRKKLELRYNDRNYKVNNILWLEEHDPKINRFGKRVVVARVDHILSYDQFPDALKDGWVVMSIAVLDKCWREQLFIK